MEKPLHDIKTNLKPARKPKVLEVASYQKPVPVEPPRALVLSLQILAYAIPLGFLAYVLYINYLPFGYDKTFTIDVGAEGDTRVGEFYLEPSPDLSERKVAADGTTYRELNGMANVIFKPNVVLKDAEITVSVEGEGVSIIPPVIDFNPDDYEWDYEWDFTNPETAFTPKTSERARAEWVSCTTTPLSTGASTTADVVETTELNTTATSTEICTQIPIPDLVGNAFFFDGGMYFDGNSQLEMPSTADMFEDGPFTLYVEWTPINSEEDFQQIIGHYNWEIWQNNNSLEFRVGRMNDQNGQIHSIKYHIVKPDQFFNKKHSILVLYEPSDRGYIQLFVDNNLVKRIEIPKEKIWVDYGTKNLSLGLTTHNYNKSPNFKGNISKVFISEERILEQYNKLTFKIDSVNESKFSISTAESGTINNFIINVEK